MSPRLSLRTVELYERRMPFARPFRFGAAVVEAAPQAFVRVEVDVEGRGRASGVTAEMMMPKWFDKNPAKSPAGSIADLRASLAQAAEAYARRTRPDTAFGHHHEVMAEQCDWARGRDLPALVGAFGPAVIDKAVLDALLRALGLGLAEGLRANAPGLDARLTPDLDGAGITDFLATIQPSAHVALRHTVGLLDELEGPNGLAAEIARARLRYFKIKIGGDVAADLDRLRAIMRVLVGHAPGFQATLDANEQYDPERLAALAAALRGDPALEPLRRRLLCIEQPFDRRKTFDTPLDRDTLPFPVIIDEADDAYGAFPRAAALGYRGVSSKSCKGLYKSLLNAARVRSWNHGCASPGRFFVSGEDLTCQAGLAVQQDTALVAVLGLGHAERNGHHYVEGFGPAPASEARAFAAAHPGLYAAHDGRINLAIAAGALPTASLIAGPGFASGAEPDWTTLDSRHFETTSEEKIA